MMPVAKTLTMTRGRLPHLGELFVWRGKILRVGDNTKQGSKEEIAQGEGGTDQVSRSLNSGELKASATFRRPGDTSSLQVEKLATSMSPGEAMYAETTRKAPERPQLRLSNTPERMMWGLFLLGDSDQKRMPDSPTSFLQFIRCVDDWSITVLAVLQHNDSAD